MDLLLRQKIMEIFCDSKFPVEIGEEKVPMRVLNEGRASCIISGLVVDTAADFFDWYMNVLTVDEKKWMRTHNVSTRHMFKIYQKYHSQNKK
jgi:hypothetical protein